MRIRAALALEKGGPFVVDECELDEPRADEVRIEVRAVGICHTDLTAKEAMVGPRLPAVLGHEGAGVVLDVGPGVTEFRAGDRVLASFGACGGCPSCAAHAPAYCRHVMTLCGLGSRLDGSSPIRHAGKSVTGHFFAQSSFASHAVVSTVNLVRIPDGVAFEHAAPLACGIQTGAGSVFNVLQAHADDSLVVLGVGPVGLAAVMAARIAGCKRVIAVDRIRARLDLAADLGATHVVDTSQDKLGKALAGLGGVSKALDTTAVPALMETAFRALRPRGVLACAGLGAAGAKLELDTQELLFAGRTVRGTIEGDAEPRTFLPRLFAEQLAGRLPVERLVRTYPLADIEFAAADMRDGTTLKPVLIP